MQCLHCRHDSKYKDRTGGRCPQCRKEFAFEPKAGGKFTDVGFQSAIDAVSAGDKVRWGVEHLYYELCRRLWRKRVGRGCLFPGLILLIVGIAAFKFGLGPLMLAIPLGILGVIIGVKARMSQSTGKVLLSKEEFDTMWKRWERIHGVPPSAIVRNPRKKPERAAEPDLEDYSFDRAVICDRARTVDLLLANNFHFENNCAVLAINGYPSGPFDVVRKMLKRNPRLQVFALHDASPVGCRLPYRLANDPEWFKGQAKVVDVGLRPLHAKPFGGLLLPAETLVAAGEGITPPEARWLSTYTLELAAIRPEQVLKRLYRAINRKAGDGGNGGDGGSYSSTSSGDSSSSWGVESDSDSFGSDAGASDGGADGFG